MKQAERACEGSKRAQLRVFFKIAGWHLIFAVVLAALGDNGERPNEWTHELQLLKVTLVIQMLKQLLDLIIN